MEVEYREHEGVRYTLQQGKWGLELRIHHNLTDDYIYETGFIKLVGDAEKTITHLKYEGFIKP
jgi:hypothetical protein